MEEHDLVNSQWTKNVSRDECPDVPVEHVGGTCPAGLPWGCPQPRSGEGNTKTFEAFGWPCLLPILTVSGFMWFGFLSNRQYGSLVNAILLDICSFPDYSIFLMCLNLSGQESSDLIWCWLCCLPCWSRISNVAKENVSKICLLVLCV